MGLVGPSNTHLFSIFSISLTSGKSPKASKFALFSRSFYLWPQLPSVSPQRLLLLLPLLPSCPDLRCLSLSRSYQMQSDGTTGASSNEHSDTICLSGKEVRHLPPLSLFYLPIPSTAGMALGKLGASSMCHEFWPVHANLQDKKIDFAWNTLERSKFRLKI